MLNNREYLEEELTSSIGRKRANISNDILLLIDTITEFKLNKIGEKGYRDAAIRAKQDRENQKTATNADRIRAMSDDELIEFIKNIKVRAALCKAVKDNDAFEALCSAEWLKQPVEEDDHE